MVRMKRTRPLLIILVLAAGLLLVALTLLAGADLRTWMWRLTGEEELFGQVRGVGQLALNITQPPLRLEPYAEIAHTGVNPFGINTFLHQEVEPEKRERQMQLIAEAGFRWIREEFPWEDIEIHGRGDFTDRRNDPPRDAWEKYDEIVALANEYGIEMIVRLSNPPAWTRAAGDEVGPLAPPDDYDDFANYAATVARRYAGQVRYFQVWNEPNIYPEWGEQAVDPEAYTRLLCTAYDAIKAANPDAVVLSAALAPTVALDGRDLNDLIFLQRMYDAGAGECFDILAAQDYMLWSGPTDRRMNPVNLNFSHVAYVRDVMVRNGDAAKPIWITEMNSNASPEDVIPVYGRVTLEQQARYAPIAYERVQKEWPFIGVVNFWYFKRADWSWLEERRPEAYFQMADPDFNLMPVYESMKAYANQPPVMHIGRHRADHWTLEYGTGWREGPDGVWIAGEDAAPLSFTFEGTSLAATFGEGSAAGAELAYRVDGGPPRRVSASQPEATLWRGAAGEHTIVIEPVGGVALAGFTVRNDPSLTWAGVLVGVVVLSGALYLIRRRTPVLSEVPQ